VIRFEPNGAVNGRLAELYLIGVVKKGPEGNTVVRNRIYERTLRDYVRLADEAERASLRTRLEIHRHPANHFATPVSCGKIMQTKENRGIADGRTRRES